MLTNRIFGYPSLKLRSPFEELDRMKRDMDRLLGAYGNRRPRRSVAAGVFPALNISEDKSGYYVRAELPGMSGDDLNIQIIGKNLTIEGERKIAIEKADAKFHRREREGGKFSRIVALPGEIDSDKIEAGLENGILTIVIPKAEAAKPKQIQIR